MEHYPPTTTHSKYSNVIKPNAAQTKKSQAVLPFFLLESKQHEVYRVARDTERHILEVLDRDVTKTGELYKIVQNCVKN